MSLLGQLAANVALATWIAAEATRIALFAGGDLLSLSDAVLIAALSISALFALVRPAPTAEDTSLIAWLASGAAVVSPALYLLLPVNMGGPRVGNVVEGCALIVMLLSTLALGRNFSILPQYRWLVTSGPYAWVRHPLYASYLAFDAAHALGRESWAGAVLWMVEAALFNWRAACEERLLTAADPRYADYAVTVRWRFFPHIL